MALRTSDGTMEHYYDHWILRRHLEYSKDLMQRSGDCGSKTSFPFTSVGNAVG